MHSSWKTLLGAAASSLMIAGAAFAQAEQEAGDLPELVTEPTAEDIVWEDPFGDMDVDPNVIEDGDAFPGWFEERTASEKVAISARCALIVDNPDRFSDDLIQGEAATYSPETLQSFCESVIEAEVEIPDVEAGAAEAIEETDLENGETAP